MKKLGKEFIDALKMYVKDDRVVRVSRVGNIRWYVEDDRVVE